MATVAKPPVARRRRKPPRPPRPPGPPRPPVDTATGLDPLQLRGLGEHDRVALAAWMGSVAGDNDGRPWWPHAIRSMPLAGRLRLAIDPAADQAWREHQRRLVRSDLATFTFGYGHMQPEVGDPIPLVPWEATDQGAANNVGAVTQADVVALFEEHMRIIILKARQLGLTWLALHYAVWLQAFCALTPNAKILCLSKHGQDATKLLGRARRIMQLLPPFLRIREAIETHRSLTKFKLEGRGEMVSLAGTPEAARMETATLALLDEFAHIKNKNAEPTWTAVQPTLGSHGKAIVIFTGNGPAETPGNGQAAAKLWERARSGEANLTPVFLCSGTHPDRTDAWHASKRREFLSDEDFEAEYPDTEGQALAGKAGDKVYPPAGINAAERLGAELDLKLDAWLSGQAPPATTVLGDGPIPDPDGGMLHPCWDWGEYTHGLLLWPLEGGGVYVLPGEVRRTAGEVGEATDQLMNTARALQHHDRKGVLVPRLDKARYDSAGVQSMRTFVKRVRTGRFPDGSPWAGRPYLQSWVTVYAPGAPKPRTVKVRFNEYKDDTKNYLRRLFTNAAKGKTTQVIAISPRNRVLLRELRGLELKDDGTGRIEKGNDHGPDALIAGMAPQARANRGERSPEDEESV